MEELVQKMVQSGIEYKGGDFKPEVHFFGQIVGASNVMEDDGVFVEAFFEIGDKWMCLSPVTTIQTQTSYKDVLNSIK